MKKTFFLSLVAFATLFISLSSFKGSLMEDDTRKVGNFSKIGLAYPADVVLRQGNTQSLRLVGDADDLAKVITEVKDGRLSIRQKEQNMNWNSNNKRITIYITVPQVEALSVSGSGKITSDDTFKTRSLDLAVSGSGSIRMNAQVDNVSSRISGSGKIELKGEGKQSTVAVSGSGSLKGYDFKAAEAKVSISGSGTCEITATNTLKTSISGSGRVLYEGSPSVDSRVSGSGSVKKRG